MIRVSAEQVQCTISRARRGRAVLVEPAGRAGTSDPIQRQRSEGLERGQEHRRGCRRNGAEPDHRRVAHAARLRQARPLPANRADAAGELPSRRSGGAALRSPTRVPHAQGAGSQRSCQAFSPSPSCGRAASRARSPNLTPHGEGEMTGESAHGDPVVRASSWLGGRPYSMNNRTDGGGAHNVLVSTPCCPRRPAPRLLVAGLAEGGVPTYPMARG